MPTSKFFSTLSKNIFVLDLEKLDLYNFVFEQKIREKRDPETRVSFS